MCMYICLSFSLCLSHSHVCVSFTHSLSDVHCVWGEGGIASRYVVCLYMQVHSMSDVLLAPSTTQNGRSKESPGPAHLPQESPGPAHLQQESPSPTHQLQGSPGPAHQLDKTPTSLPSSAHGEVKGHLQSGHRRSRMAWKDCSAVTGEGCDYGQCCYSDGWDHGSALL